MPLDVLSKIQRFAKGGEVQNISNMVSNNPSLEQAFNGIANAATNGGANINSESIAKTESLMNALVKATKDADLSMLGLGNSIKAIDSKPLETAEATVRQIADNGRNISIGISVDKAQASLKSLADRIERIRSSATISVSLPTSPQRPVQKPQKFATGGRVTYHKQNTETAQTGGIFRRGSSTGDRNMIFANKGEGIITEKAIRQGAKQRGMSPEMYIQALNHPSVNLGRIKKGRSFMLGGTVGQEIANFYGSKSSNAYKYMHDIDSSHSSAAVDKNAAKAFMRAFDELYAEANKIDKGYTGLPIPGGPETLALGSGIPSFPSARVSSLRPDSTKSEIEPVTRDFEAIKEFINRHSNPTTSVARKVISRSTHRFRPKNVQKGNLTDSVTSDSGDLMGSISAAMKSAAKEQATIQGMIAFDKGNVQRSDTTGTKSSSLDYNTSAGIMDTFHGNMRTASRNDKSAKIALKAFEELKKEHATELAGVNLDDFAEYDSQFIKEFNEIFKKLNQLEEDVWDARKKELEAEIKNLSADRSSLMISNAFSVDSTGEIIGYKNKPLDLGMAGDNNSKKNQLLSSTMDSLIGETNDSMKSLKEKLMNQLESMKNSSDFSILQEVFETLGINTFADFQSMLDNEEQLEKAVKVSENLSPTMKKIIALQEGREEEQLKTIKDEMQHAIEYNTAVNKAFSAYQSIDIEDSIKRMARSNMPPDQHQSVKNIAAGFEQARGSDTLNKVLQSQLESQFTPGTDMKTLMENLSQGRDASGGTANFAQDLKKLEKIMKALIPTSESLGKGNDEISKKFDNEAESVKKTLKEFPLLNQMTDKNIAKTALMVAGISMMSKQLKQMMDGIASFATEQAELSKSLTMVSQSASTFANSSANVEAIGRSLNMTRKQAVELGEAMREVALKGIHGLDTVTTVADNLKNALGKVDTTLLKEAVNLINDLPKEQVDVMIHGTGSFDDKANLIANLMNDGNLEKTINLMMNGAFGDMEGSVQLDAKDKAVIEAQEKANELLDDIKAGLYDMIPKSIASQATYYSKMIGSLTKGLASLLQLYIINKNVALIAGKKAIGGVKDLFRRAPGTSSSLTHRANGGMALAGNAIGVGLLAEAVTIAISKGFDLYAKSKAKKEQGEYRRNKQENLTKYGNTVGYAGTFEKAKGGAESWEAASKAAFAFGTGVAAAGAALAVFTGGLSLLGAAVVTGVAAITSGVAGLVAQNTSLKANNAFVETKKRDGGIFNPATWDWAGGSDHKIVKGRMAEQRSANYAKVLERLDKNAEKRGNKSSKGMLKELVALNKHVKAIEMASKGKFTAFDENSLKASMSLMKQFSTVGGTNEQYRNVKNSAFAENRRAYATSMNIFSDRRSRIMNDDRMGTEAKANALYKVIEEETKMHEKFISNLDNVINTLGNAPSIIVNNLRQEIHKAFADFNNAGFAGSDALQLYEAMQDVNGSRENMSNLMQDHRSNLENITNTINTVQAYQKNNEAEFERIKQETGISGEQEAISIRDDVMRKNADVLGDMVDLKVDLSSIQDLANEMYNASENQKGQSEGDKNAADKARANASLRVEQLSQLKKYAIDTGNDDMREEIDKLIKGWEQILNDETLTNKDVVNIAARDHTIASYLQDLINQMEERKGQMSDEDQKTMADAQKIIMASKAMSSANDMKVAYETALHKENMRFIEEMQKQLNKIISSMKNVLESSSVQLAKIVKDIFEKSQEFNAFGGADAVFKTMNASLDELEATAKALNNAEELLKNNNNGEDVFSKGFDELIKKQQEAIAEEERQLYGNETEKKTLDVAIDILKAIKKKNIEEEANKKKEDIENEARVDTVTVEGNTGTVLRDFTNTTLFNSDAQRLGFSSTEEMNGLSSEKFGEKILDKVEEHIKSVMEGQDLKLSDYNVTSNEQIKKAFAESQKKNVKLDYDTFVKQYVLKKFSEQFVGTMNNSNATNDAKLRNMSIEDQVSDVSKTLYGGLSKRRKINETKDKRLEEAENERKKKEANVDEEAKKEATEREKALKQKQNDLEAFKDVGKATQVLKALRRKQLESVHTGVGLTDEEKKQMQASEDKIRDVLKSNNVSETMKNEISSMLAEQSAENQAAKEYYDKEAQFKQQFMTVFNNIPKMLDAVIMTGRNIALTAKQGALESKQTYTNKYGSVEEAINMRGDVMSNAEEVMKSKMATVNSSETVKAAQEAKKRAMEIARSRQESGNMSAEQLKNFEISLDQQIIKAKYDAELKIKDEYINSIQKAVQVSIDAINRYTEGLSIQKDLFETIGAPFEYILDIEQEMVRSAKAEAEVQEELLAKMEKSGTTGAVLEEQKLKVMKANAAVVKATFGAQRDALDKLLGKMMGGFEQIGGIFGPDSDFMKARKAGQGFTQLPSGMISASGGTVTDYANRVQGLGLAAKMGRGDSVLTRGMLPNGLGGMFNSGGAGTGEAKTEEQASTEVKTEEEQLAVEEAKNEGTTAEAKADEKIAPAGKPVPFGGMGIEDALKQSLEQSAFGVEQEKKEESTTDKLLASILEDTHTIVKGFGLETKKEGGAKDEVSSAVQETTEALADATKEAVVETTAGTSTEPQANIPAQEETVKTPTKEDEVKALQQTINDNYGIAERTGEAEMTEEQIAKVAEAKDQLAGKKIDEMVEASTKKEPATVKEEMEKTNDIQSKMLQYVQMIASYVCGGKIGETTGEQATEQSVKEQAVAAEKQADATEQLVQQSETTVKQNDEALKQNEDIKTQSEKTAEQGEATAKAILDSSDSSNVKTEQATEAGTQQANAVNTGVAPAPATGVVPVATEVAGAEKEPDAVHEGNKAMERAVYGLSALEAQTRNQVANVQEPISPSKKTEGGEGQPAMKATVDVNVKVDAGKLTEFFLAQAKAMINQTVGEGVRDELKKPSNGLNRPKTHGVTA